MDRQVSVSKNWLAEKIILKFCVKIKDCNSKIENFRIELAFINKFMIESTIFPLEIYI